MQQGDAFRDRERALEESFFHVRNQELLAKLKETVSAENAKQSIREICQIDDDEVLDKLVQAGLGGESMAALSLAPLVLVAWADGKIDAAERRAVMSAASAERLEGVCLELLEGWLSERPEPTLKEAWISYVGILVSQLSSAARKDLETSVMGRAEKVAKAAGGTLGLNRISTSEQAMLKELKAAFTP